MLRRTKAEDDLLFQVLQKAKHRLEYLTPNDWVLIVDKSKPKSLKANEVLIEPGKPRGLVYLLIKGSARIESSTKAVISKIGPGEICGEMSFLENQLASAWVIADEPVEAYGIDWSTLHELFELFPHLASRFYRSLAVNLSRRLRDQIGTKK
jgi:CRP/FNR family cyclic AMP-dependent transcriptional regulator